MLVEYQYKWEKEYAEVKESEWFLVHPLIVWVPNLASLDPSILTIKILCFSHN